MASINIERAYRLKRLPPYLFAEIDRMKQKSPIREWTSSVWV